MIKKKKKKNTERKERGERERYGAKEESFKQRATNCQGSPSRKKQARN